MNRLEELIQTLCPDDVEHQELAKLADIGTGNSNRVDATDDGKYPFFVRSKNVMRSNKYDFDEEAIVIPGEGGIGEIFHYIHGKYDLHQRAYRIRFRDSRVNTRFAYYYMKSNFKKFITMKAVTATVISIRMPMIASFLLPIPPLPVQEEIVRILDTFTALDTELEAELAARTKQYEHYRNALFEENQRSEKKTLGDIGKVCMCRRIYKEQTNSSGDVPFFKIGTFGKEPDAFISKELFEEYKSKYSYPKKGNILFSAAGTIGRTVIFDGSPSYFQDSNIVWIDNDETLVLNKYLYYFYSLGNWATSEGGTIARLYNDNISRTPIPVPPLEVQEQIVSILDRFDTLVNDFKSGLPAEIALRRKQYEYYRDKLLTFQPLE